jgi:polypeptide N-acetylgalactosaminyltransferase
MRLKRALLLTILFWALLMWLFVTIYTEESKLMESKVRRVLKQLNEARRFSRHQSELERNTTVALKPRSIAFISEIPREVPRTQRNAVTRKRLNVRVPEIRAPNPPAVVEIPKVAPVTPPKFANHSHFLKDELDWKERLGAGLRAKYKPLGKPEIPEHDLDGPGEMGQAFEVDYKNLSPTEKEEYDRGFKRNAFNQFASDRMSVHRTLPDYRELDCRAMMYPSDMPTASVIVIFHNEAWSVLLRTVYSILERSPPRLLQEVVLVDDFSEQEHLHDQLEAFVATQDKVKLVRSKKREGLIRARLLGASVAKGQVLVFLDSHCECTPGWLEPLMHRISEDWSHVVTPIIDVINDTNLKYMFNPLSSGFSVDG